MNELHSSERVTFAHLSVDQLKDMFRENMRLSLRANGESVAATTLDERRYLIVEALWHKGWAYRPFNAAEPFALRRGEHDA